MQEQFALIPNELIIHKQLSNNAKKVYMILSVNLYGKEIEYKLNQLFNEVKISKSGLSKMITKLENFGYLIMTPGKGRNNSTKFQLPKHPTKQNDIHFTKIERRKIYSIDSDNLLLYGQFKMIFDVIEVKKVELFIKANCSFSPWYSAEQVLAVTNKLSQLGLIDFRYKITIPDENIKKEARPQSSPTSNHVNNIQQSTPNITVKQECPWHNDTDWQYLKGKIDSAKDIIKGYEKQQQPLNEEDSEILNAYKKVYADNSEKIKTIEQHYLGEVQ